MYPRTLRELTDYLDAHPHVEFIDHRGERSEQVYIGLQDGSLYFSDCQTGLPSHVPIDCGMTAAETGLEFAPDRFTVTKFGVTLAFRYLEDPR